MAVETLHLHKLHVDAEGLPHTIVIIFTDHESEWRCTAATCGVVGNTCGIPPEE
ncbi:uncharacterized protein DS421_2g50390 [Arachis hypogaea]|nr:uncharacterized protein DS421_2g50390 [Arachis hypogaea]